jgi:hypothetical protein
MVVFAVAEPNRPVTQPDSHEFRQPVGYTSQAFRQMDGGVCIVPDAKQQDLSVQLMHPANRALLTMRRQGQRVGNDALRLRACGRERMGMLTAQGARLAPEQLRDDAQIEIGRRSLTGSKGVSSSPDQDGMTSVPPGPSASRSAPISPSGPPSTGRTARNEV